MRGFALAGALALAAAQDNAVFSFSGEFVSTSPQTQSAYIDTSDGLCYPYSTTYYYTTFNHTFATAGVYAFYGFNTGFVGVVQGSVTNINTTDPCSSNVYPLTVATNNEIGAPFSTGHWFSAATYTFVVGGYYTGAFGGEIWPGSYNGMTNGVANKTWNPVYESSGCYDYASPSLYDAQRITVASSGYYQVFLAWAQNSSLAPGYQVPLSDPIVAVLKGDYTAADLSASSCTSLGADYVKAQRGSGLTAQMFNVWMDAGANYTLIATGGYESSGSYVGHYTITVTPGKRAQFTNITTFQRPDYSSCDAATTFPSTCTDYSSPNTGEAYGYATFNVPKNSNFYIYGEEGDGRDLEFFIYNEVNSLRLTCGTLGQRCFDAIDTMTGNTLFSGNSDNFTVIATQWTSTSGTIGSDGYFTLYTLSGPALPGFTTSLAPTVSAAPTNSAAPTPGSGTAAPTQAPTAAPTVSAAPTSPTVSSAPSAAPTASAAPTVEKVNSGAFLAPCVALVGVLSLLA